MHTQTLLVAKKLLSESPNHKNAIAISENQDIRRPLCLRNELSNEFNPLSEACAGLLMSDYIGCRCCHGIAMPTLVTTLKHDTGK